MSRSYHQLSLDALALPPDERLALAHKLIDSVEGPADPEMAAAWAAELRQRTATADEREAAGEPRGEDWERARGRVLRGLSKTDRGEER